MTNKTICDWCGKTLPKKEYDSPQFDSSYVYFLTGDSHVAWNEKYDLCCECTHKILKLIGKKPSITH